MMGISPEMSDPLKQCTLTKFQNIPFFDFDEKERAYKLRIETGIHVLKNECPGKKRKL
jgi:hypothetical protein